jgi:uncharacterized protein DUF3147
MLKDILLRFIIGGTVVCIFSLLSDLFKPRRFAGLFGAAPSVALATIGLTVASQGKSYGATEARSMVGGAVALLVYASCVAYTVFRCKTSPLWTTISLLVVWFAISFGVWIICLT